MVLGVLEKNSTNLDKAESDVIFADTLVLFGEESRRRYALQLPVLTEPLDKPIVFVFILFAEKGDGFFGQVSLEIFSNRIPSCLLHLAETTNLLRSILSANLLQSAMMKYPPSGTTGSMPTSRQMPAM